MIYFYETQRPLKGICLNKANWKAENSLPEIILEQSSIFPWWFAFIPCRGFRAQKHSISGKHT